MQSKVSFVRPIETMRSLLLTMAIPPGSDSSQRAIERDGRLGIVRRSEMGPEPLDLAVEGRLRHIATPVVERRYRMLATNVCVRYASSALAEAGTRCFSTVTMPRFRARSARSASSQASSAAGRSRTGHSRRMRRGTLSPEPSRQTSAPSPAASSDSSAWDWSPRRACPRRVRARTRASSYRRPCGSPLPLPWPRGRQGLRLPARDRALGQDDRQSDAGPAAIGAARRAIRYGDYTALKRNYLPPDYLRDAGALKDADVGISVDTAVDIAKAASRRAAGH